MSAQTDKAAFVVAFFNEAGKLTGSKFFRADERAQADRLVATRTGNGQRSTLSEVAR